MSLRPLALNVIQNALPYLTHQAGSALGRLDYSAVDVSSVYRGFLVERPDTLLEQYSDLHVEDAVFATLYQIALWRNDINDDQRTAVVASICSKTDLTDAGPALVNLAKMVARRPGSFCPVVIQRRWDVFRSGVMGSALSDVPIEDKLAQFIMWRDHIAIDAERNILEAAVVTCLRNAGRQDVCNEKSLWILSAGEYALGLDVMKHLLRSPCDHGAAVGWDYAAAIVSLRHFPDEGERFCSAVGLGNCIQELRRLALTSS